MRTLNRPMFNMGGPIKQGIMHGIREPYAGGQLVRPGPGRPGYAGEETFWTKLAAQYKPKNLFKWSRINPFSSKKLKAATNVPKVAPLIKKGVQDLRGIFVRKPPSSGITSSGTGQTFLKNLKSFSFPGSTKALDFAKRVGTYPFRKPKRTALGAYALSSDPAREAMGYVGKNIPNIIKGLTPNWIERLISGEDKDAATDGFLKSGAAGGASLKEIAAAKKLSDEEKNAFAITQRNDRVEKYLKMMGYDRAKKTAIADALIDASKIVGDRGTLDLKNIGQDLINPIIQATSKRLDKPDQIREAVGLMATKAEIEKDLEDPSIKALRLEQLKELRGGFAKDIGDFVLSAKGTKVKQKALERYARSRAHEHELDFTVITDEDMAGVGAGADSSLETIIQSVVKDDGVYMIGDAIIQVSGGVPKQIA